MTLTSLLEHFGIAVAALSGVLAARGKQLDLFGVLVLALVTAFGGGSLRDMLAGDGPVGWLQHREYFWTAMLSAVLAFYGCRWWEPPAMLLQVADALALGFFAVAGTRKGLGLGFAPEVAVALGVVTGVAGGIIRDTLTNQVPVVFRRDTYFYATAAMFGGTVFCLLHGRVEESLATWSAVVAGIALRLGALRWRLALPVFEG